MAEGPGKNEQMLSEPDQPTISLVEEESALMAAKVSLKKRQREGHEFKIRKAKRLKISQNLWLNSIIEADTVGGKVPDESTLRRIHNPKQGGIEQFLQKTY